MRTEEATRIVGIDGRELRLTNLDKVLYPAAGFTKAAALDYYARIAPDRPTVSIPLTWAELERAVDRSSAGSLLAGPDEALGRVEHHGDLFSPVLTCVQEPPAG